jgi:hypothetical protein
MKKMFSTKQHMKEGNNNLKKVKGGIISNEENNCKIKLSQGMNNSK